MPSLGGIILALILMNKLRTSYVKELKEEIIDGESIKSWVYTFEDEIFLDENLLDSDIN